MPETKKQKWVAQDAKSIHKGRVLKGIGHLKCNVCGRTSAYEKGCICQQGVHVGVIKIEDNSQ